MLTSIAQCVDRSKMSAVPGLTAVHATAGRPAVIALAARSSNVQTASLQCFSVNCSESYVLAVTAFGAKRDDRCLA